MCTVSYFPNLKTLTSSYEAPAAGQVDNYVLTTNRDEAPQRTAAGLISEIRYGKTLLFPQDPLAKGTWIAASDTNQLVCILNGAFTRHQRRPPYRLSRGLMALEFFAHNDAKAFVDTFNFAGMESFTMVIFDDGQLYDLRWDERQTTLAPLDPLQMHIWASPTLYSKTWREKRLAWFKDWKTSQAKVDPSAILHFHKTGGEGDPENDLVMNRQNLVRTTSITSVVTTENQIKMRYEDLLVPRVSKAGLLLYRQS